MQLLAVGAGQQHSSGGCAPCVSWMPPPRGQFSSWGWVSAISSCLLLTPKHSLAQSLAPQELHLTKEDSCPSTDLWSSYNSSWPDISRPGGRKKTLSKEMTHVQKDFSCSCSHAFYFYSIFLQSLLTHTTGSKACALF